MVRSVVSLIVMVYLAALGLVAQAANDGDSHVAVLELQLSATENSNLHLGAADGPVLSLLPLPYALRDDI